MPKRISPNIKFLLNEILKLKTENDLLKKDREYLEVLRTKYIENRISEINSNIRKESAKSSWKPQNEKL